jgi:hypothetical protein
MEKLLKLINEYEESRWNTIDDWLTEEERENWAIIEETPTRKEYEWHLRHCNANTVAFEKDTFDAYALSKKYGFIRWLVKNDKIDRERINDRWWDMSIHFTDEELFIMSLSISNTPIEDLITYLS